MITAVVADAMTKLIGESLSEEDLMHHEFIMTYRDCHLCTIMLRTYSPCSLLYNVGVGINVDGMPSPGGTDKKAWPLN